MYEVRIPARHDIEVVYNSGGPGPGGDLVEELYPPL